MCRFKPPWKNALYGRNSVTLWIIAAIGVGLIGYGAYQWLYRTQLTPAQLEGSVELNYQLDLATMRAQSKDGKLNVNKAWERQHRDAIRAQIQAHMAKQRDTARSWALAGLAAIIFSLGRIFLVPMFQKRE